MMKKVGPFKILKKCGNNAYKIDLPPDIGLSPIFNISDIYAFKPPIADDIAGIGVSQGVDVQEDLTQLPKHTPPQIECILDKKVTKQTRRGTYYSYLVKWKDTPQEDATWLTKAEILKARYTLNSIPTQGT